MRVTVRTVRPDEITVWQETSARHLPGPGAPETMLTIRDVTARKVLEEELATFARTDGLTGLANRRALTEALDKACGSEVTPTLLMVDVDRFKLYNARFGHQAGDECLFLVAAALDALASRHGALAARYGGEEFAVVTAQAAMPAAELADRLHRAVSTAPVPTDAGLLPVTISVGLAGPGDGDRDLRLPMARADAALNQAKQTGRDRGCVAPDAF